MRELSFFLISVSKCFIFTFQTLLFVAIEKQAIDCLHWLLANGANTNAKNVILSRLESFLDK
jgi:hypothetical protein